MQNPNFDGPNAILIVDDMPVNIDALFKYLSQKGFKVFVARDGESALEQATLALPDLILLDIVMPGIDGFETCRRFKAQDATKDIPVIFMTALADTGDKIKGFEVGAVDYVTKPIQHEEVLARITAHLTIRSLQQRLEWNNLNLEKEVTERQHAENALQEANESLETRVQQRTGELAETNDRLRSEVAERRKTEVKLRHALEEVELLTNRLQDENVYLQEEIKTEFNFEEIIGSSAPMQDVYQQIQQVADTGTTVLISGETGTGKELVARAIHDVSDRKNSALIKVNCAALPAGLIESELFGHEKGAYTGATAQKKGRFELADGGTILLDEVGELPPETQVKLLRVLQEQEFERVGGTVTLKVDVRVIAATNRELEEQVANGAFRADLYYRLSIFPIHIPALRDRQTDIPTLVHHFIDQHARRMGKSVGRVGTEAMQTLTSYGWPGNVRELNNVMERAVILCRGDIIQNTHLSIDPAAPAKEGTAVSLMDVERAHITKTLEQTRWVVGGSAGAATRLGLKRTTLIARMKKLGITR